MSRDYNKKHFNKWSKFYDRDVIWGNYFTFGYNEVIKILEQKIYEDKIKTILDVGCGTGELEHRLSKFNKLNKIVAIDFSEKMLDIAKKKNFNQNIHFILHDIDEIKFPNQKFDAITVLNVLHHTKDLKLLINNLFNLLKPGGILIIIDPIYDNFIKKVWCYFLKFVLIPEKKIKYYSLKEIQLALENFNLKIVFNKNIYYFSKLLLISKL